MRARAPLFALSFALFGIWGAFTLALLAPPISFPAILVAASMLAVARMSRERATFDHMLPLVVAGTTLGTLQSQGVAGSTFGIFPLLVVAIASLTRDVARFVPLPSRIAPLTGVAIAGVIAMSGAFYTIANVRLTFIDVNAAGPVHHATFPSLAGLSARGPYLADLDEMLTWARDNIPANDPVAFLPGEEPAFYALGWRPRLPSVYFYDVATPYTPAEMARFANDVGLRWVFVKDRLQLKEEPPLEQALVTELTRGATLFTRVGPYRVYKRG